MSSGKAIIFSAPSGAGKTTIVQHLLQRGLDLEFSISATTREPRKIEQPGKDYFYFSIPEFLEKVKKDEFCEWEEVYTDNYYGTLKSEIERVWSSGKNVIFDVDVKGGISLKKYFGEKALSIFVKPPSIESLKERLEKRETETLESIARRIGKAEQELKQASEFDFILVNDDLEEAFSAGEEVITEFLENEE
ncbi:MAG: guanylate kinase [Flavobacteriales bacterium]